MIIEKRNVSELLPAPYNPRIQLRPDDPAWEKLERSIEQFDLVQPIVWNRRTGHVVSGHQRLTVLKQRGQTEFDCVIVDLSLEQEKALNVTLNNNHVGSDWDAGKLVELVSELQALPDFDATLTGFDEQQLCDLVFTPAWDEGSDTASETETEEQFVHAVLEVPPDMWGDIEQHLDDILQTDPRIRLHVNKS